MLWKDRVGVLVTALPRAEGLALSRMISENDEDIECMVKKYDSGELLIDELKLNIVQKAVKAAIDYRFAIFKGLFSHISTEQAKQIVKSSSIHSTIAEEERPSSLTYGEIDFFSFSCILEKLNIIKGNSFVDLGHGTGRALVCASFLYGDILSSCVGIEIVPELYASSVDIISRHEEIIQSDPMLCSAEDSPCRVRVIQGDILQQDCDGFDWCAAGMRNFYLFVSCSIIHYGDMCIGNYLPVLNLYFPSLYACFYIIFLQI